MSEWTTKDLDIVTSHEKLRASKFKGSLKVCTGTGCVSSHSFKLKDKLSELIKEKGLENDYEVVGTGCHGFCAKGPIILVEPEGIFYQEIKEKDLDEIVESHLVNNKPVQRLMYTDPVSGDIKEDVENIQFFARQELIALRNKGIIDPESIEQYIARDGYKALSSVLSENNPESVIDTIIASGLRGRGGGGFPTGVKWRSGRNAAKAKKEEIYVVCNADEGDPGAFMDRSILETDPHSVIEGMVIGAFATGAHEGFVYVRKEYPLALDRLRKALADAREHGLLGHDILGSGFSFDIFVHVGAGAFVCGESTALMASMSGRAGEPSAKYIHNVEQGYRDKPTVLNNVETWANIPVIINKGVEWFTSIGTGDVSESPWGGSKGTKVFSLVGNINNSGLVEVPMGMSLREIIYDIGGGIPDGKKFKAVQTGGPSGGCIPASMLDMKVDFDSLAKAGSMMGSGGMIVMDENTCMVDVARYFIDFLVDESCGKCTPCREGLNILNRILTRICEGKGEEGDIELLEEVSSTIADTSLCQLGATAPNPVLSTIRYFRNEYEEHIRDKKCSAGVCKNLVEYYIIPDNCTGCTLCSLKCPVKAISGEKKGVHVIDPSVCIKCGICYEVCNFNAVEVK